MKENKRLLIIDAFGLFFRAYYAFINNPLRNSRGEETSVLHGFLNMLLRLKKERPHEALVLALDGKGKTFRHEMDKNYKAQRPPTPEPLKEQIAYLLPLLEKLGVPMAAAEGWEADDIIATYARMAKNEGWQAEVVSGDKDLLQLMSEGALILSPDKNGGFSEMTADAVVEKFGVGPGQIGDYLSLLGDSSDNIPGVPGIGKKTASELLTKFGSLAGIYENLHLLKSNSVRTKLENGRAEADLSRKLVSLAFDVPSLAAIEKLRPAESDKAGAKAMLEAKELTSLISKLGLDKVQSSSPASDPADSSEHPSFKRKIVRAENLEELKAAAIKHGIFAFDFETTSLDTFAARIVCVTFAFPDLSMILAEILSADFDDTAAALPVLKEIFENPDIRKVGHNLKYECSILDQYNIRLKGIHFDTMLSAWAYDSSRNSYGLESQAETRLGWKKKTFEEMLAGAADIFAADKNELFDYAFNDAEATWLLYELFSKELSAKQQKVLNEIDVPCIEVLSAMERKGVLVDAAELTSMGEVMGKEIAALEKAIHLLAGSEFNIGSPKQMQEILFEKLGLHPVRKTKTGYSTDVDALNRMAGRHPIIDEILRYRAVTKLKNTYLDALPLLVNPATGHIHTSYHQTGTATGRISSTEPNLQNIPIKMKEGKAIRRTFKAGPGRMVVSLDYSQVELRVLAHLAGEQTLLAAYREGRDIHRQTASLLFGIKPEEADDTQRRTAKTINFSVMYGISAFSLAEDLKVSRDEASRFIAAYFAGYPGVRKYIDRVLESARETLTVETWYGRVRPLADLTSKNALLRQRAERIAFNSVIQGTAADIIKIAMQRVHKAIEAGTVKAEMVMQVHDELVFYIDKNTAETESQKISALMKSIEPFDSILEIGASIGESWD